MINFAEIFCHIRKEMMMPLDLVYDCKIQPTADELSKSVQMAYKAALNHDFTDVSNFLIFREKFDPKLVNEMIEEYRKHIAILAVYDPLGYDIPISDLVDPVWHTHILYTQDYTSLCKKMGCSYIHHQPFVFEDEAELLMPAYREITYRLHATHFSANEKFWGKSTRVGCMTKPFKSDLF